MTRTVPRGRAPRGGGTGVDPTLLALLAEHGLPPGLARALLVIARHGPLSATELARFCGVHRVQAYRQATSLRDRGFLRVEGPPVRYRAFPLPRVLHRLEQETESKLRRLQRDRKALVRTWTRQGELASGLEGGPAFQHLHGREQVLSAYLRLARGARRTVDAVIPPSQASIPDLATRIRAVADLDARGLKIRIVTQVRWETLPYDREVARHAECRHVPELHSFRYYLVDGRGVFMILTENPYRARRELHAALWTNDVETVRFYRTHFESLFASGVPVARQLALMDSLPLGHPTVSSATAAPVHEAMQAVVQRWLERFDVDFVRVDFTGSLRSIGTMIGRGLGRGLPRGDLSRAVRALDERFEREGLGRVTYHPGTRPRIAWERCACCSEGFEEAGRVICPEILASALRAGWAEDVEVRTSTVSGGRRGMTHLVELLLPVEPLRPRRGTSATGDRTKDPP